MNTLIEAATRIRARLLNLIVSAGGGHTGGSLSAVDILVALYHQVLRIRPAEPTWPDRDRFVMSKGHSVEAYYCVLSDRGFIPDGVLDTYGAPGSILAGHPTVKVPGVELNTGALGHGLSAGVGMALASRMDKRTNRVFVLMGDGEQAEGSVWEAAMAASHFGLASLTAIIDRNHLQISGDTESIMSLEDLRARWESFGWRVDQVNGHRFEELVPVLADTPDSNEGQPHMVIAETIKGKGVSFMEHIAGWHHRVPTVDELSAALAELAAAVAADPTTDIASNQTDHTSLRAIR